MKGLVKVTPDVIKKALDVYNKEKNEAISLVKSCQEILNTEYDDLSFWKKLWYDNEYRPKWKTAMLARKFNMPRYCNNNLLEIFAEEGMIEEDVCNRVKEAYRWYNYHRQVADNVESMAKAGIDIYLTPIQAEFVNDFKHKES